ncbi:PEP-CTERM sorting domain-containing protein [Methylotuvimicrobium sp. KM2]|uniref:PEP-CTERM sorting domain-containing protein n=1 Tax=Methylotuvimicrobium sp. KM2 TaxID=3133976 RepID=UPI003101043A
MRKNFLTSLATVIITSTISVTTYASMITVSQTDNSNVFSNFNLDTGVSLGGGIFNDPIADIEYDSLGNLFALTTTGLWKRSTSGSISRLSGVSAPFNGGGDLAISSSGVITVSSTDNSNVFSNFNLDTGVSLGDGVFNDPIADIEYDSLGNLFALTTTGLWKRSTSGSISRLSGVSAPFNGGGDLAIFEVASVSESSNIPEPSTMLLLGTGLVGLAKTRIRNKLNFARN